MSSDDEECTLSKEHIEKSELLHRIDQHACIVNLPGSTTSLNEVTVDSQTDGPSCEESGPYISKLNCNDNKKPETVVSLKDNLQSVRTEHCGVHNTDRKILDSQKTNNENYFRDISLSDPLFQSVDDSQTNLLTGENGDYERDLKETQLTKPVLHPAGYRKVEIGVHGHGVKDNQKTDESVIKHLDYPVTNLRNFEIREHRPCVKEDRQSNGSRCILQYSGYLASVFQNVEIGDHKPGVKDKQNNNESILKHVGYPETNLSNTEQCKQKSDLKQHHPHKIAFLRHMGLHFGHSGTKSEHEDEECLVQDENTDTDRSDSSMAMKSKVSCGCNLCSGMLKHVQKHEHAEMNKANNAEIGHEQQEILHSYKHAEMNKANNAEIGHEQQEVIHRHGHAERNKADEAEIGHEYKDVHRHELEPLLEEMVSDAFGPFWHENLIRLLGFRPGTCKTRSIFHSYWD